ncbi:Hypothetical protein D9617_3g019390 [Elsinoe fawcettii]|nr:Hypothetical protein D9617_3g019390 [Elsinoe fawcettii]
MVRSNFDYTNRPSSGEKLGASIASDFWKKAAQEIKTVKPTARNTKGTLRKSLSTAEATPPPANAADATDASTIVQTKVEIKIPDKKLTDEGFRLIAEALTAALKARPDLALIELDISGNELTTKSIHGLTEVIKNAPDLQHLNLSKNKLCVSTTSDCFGWVAFSSACCTSPALSQLNLENNWALGARSWECFMRAVSQSSCILHEEHDSRKHDEPTDLRMTRSTFDDARPESAQDKSRRSPSKSTTGRKSMDASPLKNPVLNKTLIIIDTDNDDHGVLFKCAILQRTSTWAMPFEFVWSKNRSSMSKTGVELFDLTEESIAQIKKDKLRADFHNDTSAGDELDGFEDDPLETPTIDTKRGRAVSFSRRFLDSHISQEDKMERAIKKIQRQVIDVNGYKSVELWAAGMAALQVSRKVYILAPLRHGKQVDPQEDEHATTVGATPAEQETEHEEFGCSLERQTPVGSPQMYQTFLPSVPTTPDHSPSSLSSPTKVGKTWAATAVSTPAEYSTDFSSPVIDIGISNEPVWVKEARKPVKQLRKLGRNANRAQHSDGDGKTDLDNLEALTSRLASTHGMSRTHLDPIKRPTYKEWQIAYMKDLQAQQGGASDGYSDRSLRCQLPLTVCQRILSFTMPEDLVNILSDRQEQKAFEWGQLHDSLSTEYDWRTKDVSSQIWMLLESIDCLEYD